MYAISRGGVVGDGLYAVGNGTPSGKLGIRNQRSRCDSVLHPEEPVTHVASASTDDADLVLAIMHVHNCSSSPDGQEWSLQRKYSSISMKLGGGTWQPRLVTRERVGANRD